MSFKLLLVSALLGQSLLSAETGQAAWLRYEPITSSAVRSLYSQFPSAVVSLDDAPTTQSAKQELERAASVMLLKHLRPQAQPGHERALVLGTVEEVRKAFPYVQVSGSLVEDGFMLKTAGPLTIIAGKNDRGVLYGTFAFLRRLMLHQPVDLLDLTQSPYAPVRWVNEWDNLDGSIERGYAGRSIFFDDNNVVADLTRASQYARLLASVGINGCTVNNVNANPRIVSSEFLPQLVRIAEAFRPWGVRLSISVPFAGAKTVGGLDTFDPLDPKVSAWWKQKVDEIYRAIPDFGGLLVKADSEGQAGPSAYGRTQADAANVLANALAPHGGILVYRGFVYNHHMDWRDLKNDRARAAYDIFHPLDGKFAENAAVQIKYGPIDFQALEPASPLIAALPHSNEILELQITQEYTGQQRHLCYLVPMWKRMLDFDYRVDGKDSPMKALVAGHITHRPFGGFAGVSNVGLDPNWDGYDLTQANLYGFGRLAWDPDLSAEQITDEWTRMTWGHDEQVVQVVSQLELESWRVYEGYTGPLGLQTMTDILHGHYGPGIESAERNGWGQWIRADHSGIGMDRTVATGTGYTAQYPPEVMRRYESVDTTPDEIVLFMHHLPYTHQLHSGETIVQHVYDTHYAAAAEAQEFPKWWASLRGRVDDQRFRSVLDHLEYQAGHAAVWRDAICQWFQEMSGIDDLQHRVGNDPHRVEAENMQLTGYRVIDVTPWEDASKGKAVSCDAAPCTASFKFEGAAGWHDIAVQYFDTDNGAAQFELRVNDSVVARWTADATLPGTQPNGDTSTRYPIDGVYLQSGDLVRLEGVSDNGDRAALDYVEVR